jgi:hypothetical protein
MVQGLFYDPLIKTYQIGLLEKNCGHLHYYKLRNRYSKNIRPSYFIHALFRVVLNDIMMVPNGQYGTQKTIDLVIEIGKRWNQYHPSPSNARIGIGDISLLNGSSMPGHPQGHTLGQEVDMRPMRKDKQETAVDYTDQNNYSKDITRSDL